MATEKRYDGYEAFQYLEAGDDYEAFELVDGPHVGEPYEVPLSEAEAERATRLMDENVVVSLHDHPSVMTKDHGERKRYSATGRVGVAYEYLAESPLDAVLFSPLYCRLWDETTRALGMRLCDLAHQDFAVQGETVTDIRRAHAEGRVALVPTVETSMLIENDLDRLDVLYGFGIRSLGITYSESNALGTGLGDQHRDGGLTNFGRDAIERMNELGILVDASHASDRTTLDACDVSDDPIILSHNGARELNGMSRLDTDEVLEAVAATGGVIGIQSSPLMTVSRDHPTHTIDSVMDHFEYVVDLVGIDHVTFGPDAMYGDHMAGRNLSGDGKSRYPEWADFDIDYVKGMENPTEAWTNVVRWLVKHDYTDEEIARVVGENTLRVLEQVWEG